MKKKFLAAIMGAAMVINVSPVITFAEPAADNGTATAAESVTDAGVTGAVSAAGVEITEAELTGAEDSGKRRGRKCAGRRYDSSRHCCRAAGRERSSGSIRAGSEQQTGGGCKN